MIHHSYWEDALGAYNPSANNLMLTTAEEAEFIKNIEDILEAAYNLQDASEMLFIHQNSVLNKRELSLEVGAEVALVVAGGQRIVEYLYRVVRGAAARMRVVGDDAREPA